jgi:hypothetical protein
MDHSKVWSSPQVCLLLQRARHLQLGMLDVDAARHPHPAAPPEVRGPSSCYPYLYWALPDRTARTGADCRAQGGEPCGRSSHWHHRAGSLRGLGRAVAPFQEVRRHHLVSSTQRKRRNDFVSRSRSIDQQVVQTRSFFLKKMVFIDQATSLQSSTRINSGITQTKILQTKDSADRANL